MANENDDDYDDDDEDERKKKDEGVLPLPKHIATEIILLAPTNIKKKNSI